MTPVSSFVKERSMRIVRMLLTVGLVGAGFSTSAQAARRSNPASLPDLASLPDAAAFQSTIVAGIFRNRTGTRRSITPTVPHYLLPKLDPRRYNGPRDYKK